MSTLFCRVFRRIKTFVLSLRAALASTVSVDEMKSVESLATAFNARRDAGFQRNVVTLSKHLNT